MTRRVRVFLLLCVLPAFASVRTSAENEFDPRPPIAYQGPADEELAESLVTDWATRRKLSAPDVAARRLGVSISVFRQNYCHPTNSRKIREGCEALLASRKDLQRAIDSYLDDAASSSEKIPSALARLAEAIGSTSEAAGWPRQDENSLRGSFRPAESTSQAPADRPLAARPDADWYCLDGDRVQIEGKMVRGGRKPGPDFSAPASSPVLEVEVSDAANLCPGSCMSNLLQTVVKAVAMWRGGCTRCADWTASVIRVGEMVFADDRLLWAVERAKASGASLETLVRGGITSRDPTTTPPGPQLASDPLRPRFEQLTGEAQDALCLVVARSSEPWTQQIHRVLCSAPGGPRVAIQIALLSQDTACGDRDAFVACARVERLVQLSAAAFSFQSSQGPSFGSGKPVKLDQVMLHEVGHWFGVPHATGKRDPRGRTNIMDGTYNRSGQCFRLENLMMLDNAIDRRSDQRLEGCTGLRYPSETTADGGRSRR